MLNSSSNYGESASGQAAEKPGASTLIWWIFPVTVWRPSVQPR